VIPKVYSALASIESIKTGWGKNIIARSDAFVWTILDEIIAQPVLDVAYLVNKYQKNDQAVRNNIDILVHAGVLTKMNQSSQRNVVYEAKAILKILDAFVSDIESV
jgi:hypothetical protein